MHCGPKVRDGVIKFRSKPVCTLGEWPRDLVSFYAVHLGDITIRLQCDHNCETITTHTIHLRVCASISKFKRSTRCARKDSTYSLGVKGMAYPVIQGTSHDGRMCQKLRDKLFKQDRARGLIRRATD